MKNLIQYVILPLTIGLSIVIPAWGSYIVPDGSISTAKIVNAAVTQAKLAPRPEVTPAPSASPAPIGNIAVSASSGSFSTSSTTLADVTNLSVTIQTNGRPVVVFVESDGTVSTTSGFAALGSSGTQAAVFAILNGATVLSRFTVGGTTLSSTYSTSGFHVMDFPAAGTYTYKVQALAVSGTQTTSANVTNCHLVAYEL